MREISFSLSLLVLCSSVALGQKLTENFEVTNSPEGPLKVSCDQLTIVIKADTAIKFTTVFKLLAKDKKTEVPASPVKPFQETKPKTGFVQLTFAREFVKVQKGDTLFLTYTLTEGNKTHTIPIAFECKENHLGSGDVVSIKSYHDTITYILKKYHRLQFNKYHETRQGDTTFIFLNQDLYPIDGTVTPECNEKNKYYKVYVITEKSEDYENAEFILENNYSTSGLGISTEPTKADGAEKKEIFKIFESETQGPFGVGVDIHVVLFKKDGSGKKYEKDRSFTIETCDNPVHVSILGGFYFSSLNNPHDIVQGAIPGASAQTLYADDAKNQSALTVMALFHPVPRSRDYSHKSLTFMQKWGVAFGTKLSQDLFKDLLLGLNYEFAKGGSFTTGLHYGQHNVIRGYDDFVFGETPYTPPNNATTFTNDQVNEQWDFGWFIGVTIDFRIIGAMRIAGKRENDLNSNSEQK